jgi:polar amino acid transport system permease protein
VIRDFGSVEFLYLLAAMRWTLGLSLLAFVCGGVVGLLVALLRVAPVAPLRWLAAGYIQLFQATPLLMLLFLVFFGLALFGLSQNAFLSVTVALTCYASAYFGEIWRGSIQAVPQTQWQGSAALGFSYLEQMRHVVLPQSVRIATPPTVGFMVQLVKNTSLASIIGFHELTHAAQYVNNVTLKPILVYGVVGALYFAVCFPLYLLSRRLEKRFNADR